VYQERLWPSPVIWALGAGLGALFGLVPAPINAAAGVVTAVIGVVVIITALALTTPIISVDGEWLRAGRARIRLDLIIGPEALDADQMRMARGRELDARAYLCIRGWLPAGVRVTLQDPDDPTPYWLISSRQPERFASALGKR
jgi:Protein of unknown function (DUF3093)